MNSPQSSAPPGQPFTVSAAPLAGTIHRHPAGIENGQGMDIPAGSMEQLQQMQQYVTHQNAMNAHGLMVQNGNLHAIMENQAMMMPMGMRGADNGISLDPQLCSGDQFGAMVTTAPMGSADYSSSSMGNTGSILTEFTKRRNWSQRILEELQDFLHILTPQGKIVYASESCKALTGFEVTDLIGKFIMDYLHEDDSGLFVREFNDSIATGNHLRMFYRFRKADGKYAIFETLGHPHIADASQTDITDIESVCKGFFMMARPYPTKNAQLLDSFLEHKIENERLMKRIHELKEEESEEQLLQRQRQHASRTESAVPSISHASSFSGNDTPMSGTHGHTSHSSDTMPPPAKPSALTRENLGRMEASSSSTRTEGIRDKMARFDSDTNPMEQIEILTGLRYREGERSKGISTGDTSPALIRGDIGVPIPMDKESRGSSDKKKKQKLVDEYVCTDCGTLDSPEWRKGPKGPKTLCNACGLRWAKKEKKRSTGQVASVPQGGGQVVG